ncbi:MAG: class II aldolase/adducin family protein [Methylomonas sp.]
MSEREGVIKYQLVHLPVGLPADIDIDELNAWRILFYRLNLIGQIPEKYDGLGFGNISRRLVPGSEQFVISGTQTGHLAKLTKQHYALIQSASPQHNRIVSCGLCAPSSEALTHASVYEQDPSIQAVIHVHSPTLWHNTLPLQLPHTAADVPYGTPEMARAVKDLFASARLDSLPLFSMLGHEDGIIAFGSSLTAAATVLITQLVKAEMLEQAGKDG